MHDPSSMALALIVPEQNDQNAENSKKKSVNRRRLKIEQRVELKSSRCMHDPSFMALALIVSEKMT